MSNIFISEETLKKLHTFIDRSRVSPEFGAEKRLKSFDDALSMLLNFALRYDFDYFESMTRIPLISGEMEVENFDNEEVRNKIIAEQFNELEGVNDA